MTLYDTFKHYNGYLWERKVFGMTFAEQFQFINLAKCIEEGRKLVVSGIKLHQRLYKAEKGMNYCLFDHVPKWLGNGVENDLFVYFLPKDEQGV